VLTTPGTPPERVKIFRDAYAKALKDPQLLLETEKAKMVAIHTWGRTRRADQESDDQPKEVVDRVKKMLGN
jgi:hypothetical protein